MAQKEGKSEIYERGLEKYEKITFDFKACTFRNPFFEVLPYSREEAGEIPLILQVVFYFGYLYTYLLDNG